jgi:hypothetical protein
MAINTCYCYNEACNQKKWEEMGKEGKRQYTVVRDIKVSSHPTPKCPYCKKKMTVTANIDYGR